jgi:hypothetical protein
MSLSEMLTAVTGTLYSNDQFSVFHAHMLCVQKEKGSASGTEPQSPSCSLDEKQKGWKRSVESGIRRGEVTAELQMQAEDCPATSQLVFKTFRTDKGFWTLLESLNLAFTMRT